MAGGVFIGLGQGLQNAASTWLALTRQARQDAIQNALTQTEIEQRKQELADKPKTDALRTAEVLNSVLGDAKYDNPAWVQAIETVGGPLTKRTPLLPSKRVGDAGPYQTDDSVAPDTGVVLPSEVVYARRKRELDLSAKERTEKALTDLMNGLSGGGADLSTPQGRLKMKLLFPGMDLNQIQPANQNPVKVETIDDKGNPVTRYLSPQEATGKTFASPKTEAPTTPYSVERARRTISAIDQLLPKVGALTTGMGGALLKNIAGTGAMNFRSELTTLAANIAFNELNQMRNASKTGGALGQISDKEEQMLSSSLGALNQDQSPENVRTQLARIRDSINRFYKAQGVDLTQPDAVPAPPLPAPTERPVGAAALVGSHAPAKTATRAEVSAFAARTNRPLKEVADELMANGYQITP